MCRSNPKSATAPRAAADRRPSVADVADMTRFRKPAGGGKNAGPLLHRADLSRLHPNRSGFVKLLTAAEVAEALRVPVSWVYAAARTGQLPCVRLGRYVRFTADDLARHVDELRTG